MGIHYEKLDGRNQAQMAIYNRHVEATGFAPLLHWLSAAILAEIEHGSAEVCFEGKVFTEREKRALRIEIVGIKALDQPVDGEVEPDVAATAAAANNPSEMTVYEPNVADNDEESVESMIKSIEKAERDIDAGFAPWAAAAVDSPTSVVATGAAMETTTPSPLNSFLGVGSFSMEMEEEAPPSFLVTFEDLNSFF